MPEPMKCDVCDRALALAEPRYVHADGHTYRHPIRPVPAPSGLPATLSTPDDVAAVCRMVGLAEYSVAGHRDQRRWRDPDRRCDVEMAAFTDSGWSLTFGWAPHGAPVGPFRLESPWSLARSGRAAAVRDPGRPRHRRRRP